MFLVFLQIPSIGKHQWIQWNPEVLLINQSTKEKAEEELKKYLPEKDKAVEKELYEDVQKTYFKTVVYEIPENAKIIKLEPYSFETIVKGLNKIIDFNL